MHICLLFSCLCHPLHYPFVCSFTPRSRFEVPIGAQCPTVGLYKVTENLDTAHTAAEAAGLRVVNIEAACIMDNGPTSILVLS